MRFFTPHEIKNSREKKLILYIHSWKNVDKSSEAHHGTHTYTYTDKPQFQRQNATRMFLLLRI